ncbi:MAG: lysylphosphatidylglycerol synthase transmembrane domain-containing protein [Candidatus Omnitrophota bacterium]
MFKLKKVLSVALRVGISIILLVLLLKFNKIDMQDLFVQIRKAHKPALALSFLIIFGNFVLCLLRWEMLLKALKIQIPFKRVVTSFSGGLFFNLFMPSTIGGDFLRTIDLAAHTKKPKEVIATVFLDRLSGFIGLVILALGSLAFGWRLIQDKSVLAFIAVIAGLLILILFVLFNQAVFSKISRIFANPNAGRIRELLRDLHQEIHYFKGHKKTIFLNVLLSILIQACAPLTFFVIAQAIGLDIHLVYFFIFLPVIGAITLLPISIGGLGLREATTTFFFAKVGVDSYLAVTMSLLNSFFIFVCGGLGGLIYVLTVHHRRLQPHQPSPVRTSAQDNRT